MTIQKEKSNFRIWGFSLTSQSQGSLPYMLLWLGSKVYTIYFKHSILKPCKYKCTYEGKTHDVTAAKELSFMIHMEEGFISFDYGPEEDILMEESQDKGPGCRPRINKIWSFPWKHDTFSKHILLNMDGTEFVTFREGKRKCVDPSYESWDYPGHERIKFTFRDGYDNSLVTATAYREKRVWTRGESWMSWLKYFTKPISCDTLCLSFDKETGSEQESYCGGVTATSIDIEGIESPLAACMRYCEENGHKFVDFVRNENGSIVYKNQPSSNSPRKPRPQPKVWAGGIGQNGKMPSNDHI